RDDRGQALAAVLSGEARLLERLGQIVGVGVLLKRPRESRPEALEVGSPIAIVDGVGEGEDGLRVTVVPLERDVDPLLLGVAARVSRPALDVLKVDDLVVDRRLGLVQVLDERLDASFVGEVVLLFGALVTDRDRDAGIEKRELPESLREAVEMELRDGENLGIRPERDFGAGLLGRPDRLDRRDRTPPLVGLLPDFSLP